MWQLWEPGEAVPLQLTWMEPLHFCFMEELTNNKLHQITAQKEKCICWAMRRSGSQGGADIQYEVTLWATAGPSLSAAFCACTVLHKGFYGFHILGWSELSFGGCAECDTECGQTIRICDEAPLHRVRKKKKENRQKLNLFYSLCLHNNIMQTLFYRFKCNTWCKHENNKRIVVFGTFLKVVVK